MTPTPLSPQVQEWRKAMRQLQDWLIAQSGPLVGNSFSQEDAAKLVAAAGVVSRTEEKPSDFVVSLFCSAAFPQPVPVQEPVAPQVLSAMNDALCDFAARWTMDGDYLRCKKCKRPHIASKASQAFYHAEGCKAAGSVEAYPWRTLIELLRPLAASPQPADDDHPCERGAREALVDELLGVMDQCKAAGMAEAVSIIKQAAVWIDPDAPIDQEPVSQPGEGATPDQVLELAQALEQRRGLQIVDDVHNLPIGGRTATMPTPFQAGWCSACEEIEHRLRTEEWELCLAPIDAASRAKSGQPGEALPAEQPKSDQANLTSASGGNDLQTALRERLRACAEEVMQFPHPSHCDHLHDASKLMREAADILQYGDIRYWCPACYADVSEPEHPALSMSMFASRADFDAAAREASAGSAGSNKNAPESSSAAPVEAVEVLREFLACRDWAHSQKANFPIPDGHEMEARLEAAWDRARTLVAQPPQAVQEVRRLSKNELDLMYLDIGDASYTTWADAILRRFAEVNGLKLAAISATTKENP